MTTPTPAPAPQPAPADDFPGKTLGIVGLVLAILVPLVGLIISFVANNQSKAAGYPNQLAKIGIIVGAILTALGLIGTIIYVVALGSIFASAGY
jgi:cytochrome b561